MGTEPLLSSSSTTKKYDDDGNNNNNVMVVNAEKSHHDGNNHNSGYDDLDQTIQTIRSNMQALHNSAVNHTYEWRKKQLDLLENMIMEHYQDFVDAIKKDLGCVTIEACCLQMHMVEVELKYIKSILHQYCQPKRIPSPAICFPAFSSLVPKPLQGPAVLVVGPSNYPLSLSIQPAIGALAAGNPVIIKPSEHCPAVAAAIQKYVHQYFSNDVMYVVQGEISEMTMLLKYAWSKIFFTGSMNVGSIIAKAASETLTPTILELGGKCPCIIDPDTISIDNDIMLIANRILWAKIMNAGQTCAAVDTIFCTYEMAQLLIPKLIHSLQIQFGKDQVLTTSSLMTRIVMKKNAKRLLHLIEQVEQHIKKQDDNGDPTKGSADSNNNKCSILFGGSKYCSLDDKFIAPTIILNPPADCDLMKEEIFGPIIPIVTTMKTRQEIIQYQQSLSNTPLCCYVFTTSSTVYSEYQNKVRCGSMMQNDCLVQLASPYIPFGGLGTSGYGVYHGKYSLEAFIQWLPSMSRPLVSGTDWNMIRFHPFIPGTWKHYICEHIITKVPAVPVLYLREMFSMMVVVSIVAIAIGTTTIMKKE